MVDIEKHHSRVENKTAQTSFVPIALQSQTPKELLCAVYVCYQLLTSMTWRLTKRNLLPSEELVWNNNLMLVLIKSQDRSKGGIQFGQFLNLKMKNERWSKEHKFLKGQMLVECHRNYLSSQTLKTSLNQRLLI